VSGGVGVTGVEVGVTGVDGLPEVRPGDDLAALVCAHATDLADGDVLVVTSKVVSKAEGRVVRTDRPSAIDAETRRVVARRGPTTIARTRHGLTMAAAGVDASNTEPGRVVLLPLDPDGSARRLRARVREVRGANVAVLLSDTAGRPWREGQTDIAVGCAGLAPLDDHAGRLDPQGNLLEVTAPAVADEIAGAADLVMGKTAGRPVAVLHGLGTRVLPAGVDGPGAAALIRPDDADMFVLGAREAALAAVCRDDPQGLAALAALTGPVPVEDLVARAAGPAGHAGEAVGVRALGAGGTEVRGPDDLATAGLLERVCALAAMHGWRVLTDDRNLGVCRIVLGSGSGAP
jgi:coenzyme F420-0:L-glutamate ligase / coenzyme F420-1:gamma-L-glutamate ligase